MGMMARGADEDFVADPRAALRAIGETISVDLTEVGERLVTGRRSTRAIRSPATSCA